MRGGGMGAILISDSAEELADLSRELVRVLKQEAVADVRVDDELGIWNVPGQQVGVHSRDKDVVGAVGDQGWLGDSGRPGELARVGMPGQGSLRAARRGRPAPGSGRGPVRW